jgi:hypothetical protein
MARVNYKRKGQRAKWPLNIFLRSKAPRIKERYCKHCGAPYLDGQKPKEIGYFTSGSVEATVFPSASWKQHELTVTFGRCKASSRQLYLSPLFTVEEFRDLARVVVQTHRYLQEVKRLRQTRNQLHRKRVA